MRFYQVVSFPAPLRLGIFVFALLLIWLPLAAPIYLLVGDPNLVTIGTMGLAFIAFLFLLRFWSQNVYRYQWRKRYGLTCSQSSRRDLLHGLVTGFLFTLSLFAFQGIVGWAAFNSPSPKLLRIVVEGLISASGIGLAEELVFRGWLLDELERDYSRQTALWASAVIFALLHFLKPLEEVIRTFVTFPALVLLGLTLVWAKWGHRDRLGICIGLHAGLVWGYYIVNVGQLVRYSGQAAPWITGIDGNPLAGVTGLLFLGILAWWMKRAQRF